MIEQYLHVWTKISRLRACDIGQVNRMGCDTEGELFDGSYIVDWEHDGTDGDS